MYQTCRRHPSAGRFLATCSGCAQELHDLQYGTRLAPQPVEKPAGEQPAFDPAAAEEAYWGHFVDCEACIDGRPCWRGAGLRWVLDQATAARR